MLATERRGSVVGKITGVRCEVFSFYYSFVGWIFSALIIVHELLPEKCG